MNLEYADIIQRVDLNPQLAVQDFAYATRKYAHTSGSRTALLESRVWALMALQNENAGVTQILEFFHHTVEAPEPNDFHEKIFWLLLAGNGQSAANECARTNHWDLKSVIELDDIPLLQRTCKDISTNTALEPYERAIYGLLSGDLESVVPLCTSWESECVARLNAARFAGEKSLGPVVRSLIDSPCASVRETAQLPLYRVLEAILSGDGQKFLVEESTTMREYVMMGGDDKEDDLDWLRVVAHLTIVFGVNPDTELLLHAYIENLIIEGILESVPAYIRFLPGQDQIKIYASVLLRVDQDEASRTLQMGLAQRFDLDIDAAVSEAVRLKIDDYTSSSHALTGLLPLAQMPTITALEVSVIQTLKWLETIHKWDDAVKEINNIIRFWLRNYQINAVLEVAAQLPLNKILNLSFADALAEERNELQNHKQLIGFFSLLKKDTADSARAAMARISDLEQYLVGVEQNNTPRIQYVPYGFIELIRCLKAASDVTDMMDLAIRIATVPQLTQLFKRTDRLSQAMDLFAHTVFTEASI